MLRSTTERMFFCCFLSDCRPCDISSKCSQLRRESVCRPGQTSVSPPPPIKSVLQSGIFQDFGHGCVNQPLWVPSSFVPSHSPPPLLSPSAIVLWHLLPKNNSLLQSSCKCNRALRVKRVERWRDLS